MPGNLSPGQPLPEGWEGLPSLALAQENPREASILLLKVEVLVEPGNVVVPQDVTGIGFRAA